MQKIAASHLVKSSLSDCNFVPHSITCIRKSRRSFSVTLNPPALCIHFKIKFTLSTLALHVTSNQDRRKILSPSAHWAMQHQSSTARHRLPHKLISTVWEQ